MRQSAATWGSPLPKKFPACGACSDLLRLLASGPWPSTRAAWTRPSTPCSPVTATTPKAQNTSGQAALHLIRSWISHFASDDTRYLPFRGCFTVGDCRRLRVPHESQIAPKGKAAKNRQLRCSATTRQLQHVAANSFSRARAGPCCRDKPLTASLYMCTGRHAPEWLLASDVSDAERR